MLNNSAFLEAVVYHKRHRPIIYEFSHKVFYLILKLNNLKQLIKPKLFSINKFNLFSLFWRDYGFKKFDDPIKYLYEILETFNLKTNTISDILLLTMPRVLGYGFNPVSFWLVFNADSSLSAVVAEVNNTFGERHSYLCFNENMTPIRSDDTIIHPKLFHVSPFCQVVGNYKFHFEINSKIVRIKIDYYDDEEILISTAITGKITKFVDKNLIKYFFMLPFVTLKVIFFIHYHALCLWIKKIPYIKKPQKPNSDIS